MAKKLMALSEYHSEGHKLHYQEGEVFEADDALYTYLMADAPDNFSEVTEEVKPPVAAKAIEEPPKNKAMPKPSAPEMGPSASETGPGGK